MSETFYLVTACGGLCAEKTSSGILDNTCEENDAQRWSIEHGDTDTQVAFRNAENGEYLFATAGTSKAKIQTSSTKQWWTLERENATGAYWIKCNDHANAYLCNSYGYHTSGNQVYVWPKEEYWTYTMTWYIQASNGTSFSARSSKTPVDGTNGDRSSVNGADGSEVSSGGADDEAVKAKEAALAEREQKLKDLLDQRFKAVKTKESELAEREQKVKELEQKEEAVNKKEQDLAAAEAAHKKEAEQLSSREREFASRQVAAVQGASDDSARERALLEREAELKHQLDEADKREQEFTAKEAAAAEKQKQAAAKEAELKKSEAELKRLEAELKKLRAEDAQREESVKSSTTSNEALKRMVRELQDALTTARHASSESAKSSAEAQELGKLRAEITRLKDYIVSQAMEGHKHRSPRKLADSHTTELERLRADNTRLRQQRELLKKQQKIVHGGPPKEVANAHGNGAKTFDCGHTFYPAPRKIEKKVTGFVGYLYEGLP